MKRAACITAAWVLLELALDVIINLATKRYHPRAGSLWWVDFVVLPLLGLTIVLATSEGAAVALVSGATVGIIDGTVGLAIGYLLGSLVGKTTRDIHVLIVYGALVHPVLLALLAAAGALLGRFIRFVLDKMRVSA
jgi:hypothetical protein